MVNNNDDEDDVLSWLMIIAMMVIVDFPQQVDYIFLKRLSTEICVKSIYKL